jgi:hypothetical protein
MSYYRLYFRGSDSGPINGVEELDAIDDIEASTLAERFAGQRVMELWCGARRVRSFAAAEFSARAHH